MSVSRTKRSAGNSSGASKAAGTAQKLSEQLQQLDGQSLKDTANLDKALELLNQRILQLHSEAAKLSGVTSELERLAAALVDNKPCPVCGALQHPHPATITAAQKSELQLKTQTITRQVQSLQLLQQSYQQAQLHLAGCEATLKANQAASVNAAKEFSALREHFKERLDASDFESQTDFLAALRTESTRKQLQQTIAAYEQIWPQQQTACNALKMPSTVRPSQNSVPAKQRNSRQTLSTVS